MRLTTCRSHHGGIVDQVWSTLPAWELLPLHCSRRRQKGSRTFMIFLGVIPVVALVTSGGVWAIMQRGRKPQECCRDNQSLMSNGALLLIILSMYFGKCVTSEINFHHHKASKLDSICVPSASELFGKESDFANIEFIGNAVQFLWTRGTTLNLVEKHATRINTFYQISRLLVRILKKGFQFLIHHG